MLVLLYNIIDSPNLNESTWTFGKPKLKIAEILMTSKEYKIETLGHVIQGQSWGNPQNPTILALHGWLDNSNSFEWLAKYFQNKYHFIAIDLPGHGHSTHLPKSAHYHFIDSIFLLKQIIEVLNIRQLHLLGHSLGACIISMAAGMLSDQIQSLLLLDNIGPMSAPEEEAFEQLFHYFEEHIDVANRKKRIIPCIEDAAKVRCLRGHLSYELAYQLCLRGVEKADGGVRWLHDPRLNAKSPLKLTEQQILDCLKEIKTPTFLLLASEGFGKELKRWQHRIELVKNIEVAGLEGGHHIHMEQPKNCAQLILNFMNKMIPDNIQDE